MQNGKTDAQATFKTLKTYSMEKSDGRDPKRQTDHRLEVERHLARVRRLMAAQRPTAAAHRRYDFCLMHAACQVRENKPCT
jgi:hypothetical protein